MNSNPLPLSNRVNSLTAVPPGIAPGPREGA
jgi:hypothetical protein